MKYIERDEMFCFPRWATEQKKKFWKFSIFKLKVSEAMKWKFADLYIKSCKSADVNLIFEILGIFYMRWKWLDGLNVTNVMKINRWINEIIFFLARWVSCFVSLWVDRITNWWNRKFFRHYPFIVFRSESSLTFNIYGGEGRDLVF